MKATLVHTVIDPRRIADAIRAAQEELVPGLLQHPGARHGYWMVHRRSGRLWVLAVWDDVGDLLSASAAEAARRVGVAERIGARTLAVQVLDVVGAHEERADQAPQVRWARATWVDSVRPDRHGALPAIFREAVPDQARTGGFCASYWLVDPTVQLGLGLSFWEGPAEVRASASHGRRRARRLEAALGCRVTAVVEFEAVVAGSSVEAAPTPAPAGHPPPEMDPLTSVGTVLGRPPGTLLAVPGERTEHVVVLVDGSVALAKDTELVRLGPGRHFGGHRIARRSRHVSTLMSTTDVRLGVLSRREFAALGRQRPDVVSELVDHDAES